MRDVTVAVLDEVVVSNGGRLGIEVAHRTSMSPYSRLVAKFKLRQRQSPTWRFSKVFNG